MILSVLAEVHTSDLTAECLRARRLAHEGKREATVGTALYRGQLWHAARRIAVEKRVPSNPFPLSLVMANAREEVRKEAGANLTDAKGLGEAEIEVEKWLAEYIDRVLPTIGRVIGQELPLRFSIDVDGVPQEFASHLDLVFTDAEGRLHVHDDKTGEVEGFTDELRCDTPTRAFLERNYQFGMYAFGVRHGFIETDMGWMELGKWPIVSWVHVRNLKPYARKASVKDFETGELVEYEKGSRRPLEKVVLPVAYTDADEGPIVEALSERVRMMRAGHWPANPSEVGCHLCESRRWCTKMGGNL